MTAAQEVGGTAIIGFGSTEVTRHPTHAIGWYAVRAVEGCARICRVRQIRGRWLCGLPLVGELRISAPGTARTRSRPSTCCQR